MALFIVFKALIIGALLGALIMFISSFVSQPTGGEYVRVSYSSRFRIIVRFFLKLITFILLLAIPFFLLKVIL